MLISAISFEFLALAIGWDQRVGHQPYFAENNVITALVTVDVQVWLAVAPTFPGSLAKSHPLLAYPSWGFQARSSDSPVFEWD